MSSIGLTIPQSRSLTISISLHDLCLLSRALVFAAESPTFKCSREERAEVEELAAVACATVASPDPAPMVHGFSL